LVFSPADFQNVALLKSQFYNLQTGTGVLPGLHMSPENLVAFSEKVFGPPISVSDKGPNKKFIDTIKNTEIESGKQNKNGRFNDS